MQKYFLKVFGCQMNQSDAERISSLLEKYKLKQTASIHEADFVIFVTCGVRQTAEDRVYGQIHNIRKKYPGKKIILTGCLAHRKDVQRRLKGKVDLFFSISNLISLISLISPTKKMPPEKCDYLKLTPKYTSSYTAHVPVMTGCNNFCSYCVVPCARGHEYSRPVEDILKEVSDLLKKGCKEITLLGQNVNSYSCHPEHPPAGEAGSRGICVDNLTTSHSLRHADSSTRPDKSGLDRNDKIISFPKLLKLIEKIPGRFWLTFLTSHPKDMSGELIETIAKSKNICEYISLPAQSGDNEILKKMNRHYTIDHYKNLIKEIRAAFLRSDLKNKNEPAISTDIIVGFPGETKKQFENTAKLLKEIKYDMAYIAQYSPRPETAAWKLKDNVSKKEKMRRDKVLTEILKKTAIANNKKYIGKVVEVLVDKKLSFEEFRRAKAAGGKSRALDSQKYLAHTRTQKKVVFSSNKKISVKKISVGSFQKVRITKSKAFGLEGKIN